MSHFQFKQGSERSDVESDSLANEFEHAVEQLQAALVDYERNATAKLHALRRSGLVTLAPPPPADSEVLVRVIAR